MLAPCREIFAITFRSSYGSASRSTTRIADSGQYPMQAPRPSQKRSLTRRTFPSMTCSAPSGQLGMHSPQPVHFSSSISMMFRVLMDSKVTLTARRRLDLRQGQGVGTNRSRGYIA